MLASGGGWRREDELLIDAAAIISGERCCWPVIDKDMIGRAGLKRDDVYFEFLTWIGGILPGYFDFNFSDDPISPSSQERRVFFNIPERINVIPELATHHDTSATGADLDKRRV